ncbi:MAG: hypothetical protein ACKOWG_02315, partial [Planctomycetia bacterium]
ARRASTIAAAAATSATAPAAARVCSASGASILPSASAAATAVRDSPPSRAASSGECRLSRPRGACHPGHAPTPPRSEFVGEVGDH